MNWDQLYLDRVRWVLLKKFKDVDRHNQHHDLEGAVLKALGLETVPNFFATCGDAGCCTDSFDTLEPSDPDEKLKWEEVRWSLS